METISKQNVLVNSASGLIAMVQADLPDHSKALMELFAMKGGDGNRNKSKVSMLMAIKQSDSSLRSKP